MKVYKILLPLVLALAVYNSGAAHTANLSNEPGDGVVQPLQTLKAERLKTDLDRRDLIQLSPAMNAGFRSLAEVLVGRLPGVQVTGNYYDYRIRIRGSRRPPLIVVDQLPFYNYDDDMVNTLLQSINLFDVASIEVIKNLGEASIYGPGAGGGVILISTRTGEMETE